MHKVFVTGKTNYEQRSHCDARNTSWLTFKPVWRIVIRHNVHRKTRVQCNRWNVRWRHRRNVLRRRDRRSPEGVRRRLGCPCCIRLGSVEFRSDRFHWSGNAGRVALPISEGIVASRYVISNENETIDNSLVYVLSVNVWYTLYYNNVSISVLILIPIIDSPLCNVHRYIVRTNPRELYAGELDGKVFVV